MNETVTKRFLLYFRLMLLVWILIANAIIHLTVACIDIPALTTHLPQFFITFIVGSVLFNGVCVLLMKPAKALAVRSVEKQGA